MTSQLLISTSSSELSYLQRSLEQAPSVNHFSTDTPDLGGLPEATQVPHQGDHQIKFLQLQAEADALLQQLQALKQQRLSGTP